MKTIITTILLLLSTFVFSQGKGTHTPIKTVEHIFNEFIKYGDAIDSDENKEAMKKAFKYLESSITKQDMPILLNVWMYYDATDFPTRNLVEPIFKKYVSWTVEAIDYRIKHKRKSEAKNEAPLSDLYYLKASLLK